MALLLAVYRAHDRIEMPLVAELRGAPTDLAGINLSESLCSAPHGFVADDDPAQGQLVLDHPQTERKTEIEPDGRSITSAGNRSPRSMDFDIVIIALK